MNAGMSTTTLNDGQSPSFVAGLMGADDDNGVAGDSLMVPSHNAPPLNEQSPPMQQFENSLQPDSLYHVVPVSDISAYAQLYWNSYRGNSDTFWENLGTVAYVRPLYQAKSACRRRETFLQMWEIFQWLDGSRLKYKKYNTPDDFVRKHLISDGSRHLTLCNKHLLQQRSPKNDDAPPQYFYTRNLWMRQILLLLFPKSKKTSGGVVTCDTPAWALDLLQHLQMDTSSKRLEKQQKIQQQQQHQFEQLHEPQLLQQHQQQQQHYNQQQQHQQNLSYPHLF